MKCFYCIVKHKGINCVSVNSHELTMQPTNPIPATTEQTALFVFVRAFSTITGYLSQYVSSFWSTSEFDKRRTADAISKLRTNLEFLDDKIEAMQKSCARYTQSARKLYKASNKTGAVHQVRLKKMYEREIRKMESLKFNIESNILHIESVGVMMETVTTIKETSDHFHIIQKHVDISKLENTIEEMYEQRDASKDIESILNDMHQADKYEDDDLLQELEDLLIKEDRALPSLPDITNPPENGAATAIILQPAEPPPDAPSVPQPLAPVIAPSHGTDPMRVFPNVPVATILTQRSRLTGLASGNG